MGWETKIIGGGEMLIWIRLGCQDDRENMEKGGGRIKKGEEEKQKKLDKKEEDGKVKLGRSKGQGILFFVKVHMSGWQAACGIQPKNLFNVCFTG